MIIQDLHLIPISGGEQPGHHDPQSIRLNSFRNNYLQNKFSKRFPLHSLETMVERVRDASQGYVSSQPMQGDEEQGLSFIPFEHTRFSKQNI